MQVYQKYSILTHLTDGGDELSHPYGMLPSPHRYYAIRSGKQPNRRKKDVKKFTILSIPTALVDLLQCNM